MLTDVQLNNRVQWVRDLLSGNFKQGNHSLTRKDPDTHEVAHCCLGVACVRVDPENVQLQIPMNEYRSEGMMHDDFAIEHFGLPYSDQRAFAGMNDSWGLTFAQIADVIAYTTANGIGANAVYMGGYHADHPIGAGRHEPIVPSGFAVEWLKQYTDK